MDWLDTTIGAMHVWQIIALVGVGVVSGSLGGLLGIGGGVVNIPMLTLVIGVPIHLAQAASMCVTPFVAVASAAGHHREKAVCMPLLKRLAPVAVVSIIAGVTASMYIDAHWLRIIFGVFLVWVAFVHARKLITGRSIPAGSVPRVTWVGAILVGGCLGFGAGLLGIGGGLITVPLLGMVCGLELRHCIATSSAVMVCTSIVGAIFKVWTLDQVESLPEHVTWATPLQYAVWLVPSCLASSWVAARLSHKLPLRFIRAIFVVLVVVAAVRLLT